MNQLTAAIASVVINGPPSLCQHVYDFHFRCCVFCRGRIPDGVECEHVDWDDEHGYCRNCGVAAECDTCGGHSTSWYCSKLHINLDPVTKCTQCGEEKVSFTRSCRVCSKLCCSYCLRRCQATEPVERYYCNECHAWMSCGCVGSEHIPDYKKPVKGCKCGCNATSRKVA
jgi:hypothetical protein